MHGTNLLGTLNFMGPSSNTNSGRKQFGIHRYVASYPARLGTCAYNSPSHPSAIALLFLAYAEYFPVVHHEMFLSCQGVVRPATDVPHTRHGVITGPPFCFTGGGG
jgi:hypothetical protein